MARRTTPHGSGDRTPVPVKAGRTAGDVARAAGAFLALAALVAGVPFSLAHWIGWPLPSRMPGLDTLTDEITVSGFTKVLAVLVWIAWAQFTACVLVEVRAAVSGVGLPRRVPGAGPSQLLARQLVAALLLVSSTAAGLAPGLGAIGSASDHAPGGVPAVAEARQTPGPERADGADPGIAESAPAVSRPDAERAGPGDREAAAPTVFYRVQPPEGRHHDTLWGISERHLGDGLRYREIYRLNKDRVQPDGTRLTEASLIRPGWILEMPADATGGELVEAPDGLDGLEEAEAAEYAEYGGFDDQPEPAPAPGPEPLEPSRPGGADTGHAFDAEPTETADAGSGPGMDLLAAAPLLAAGLLLALGRTRRNALWQAAAGTLRRDLADDLEPRGEDALDARDALLAGADPSAVAFLDQALRRLSADLDAADRTLPPVYAAWLGASELHLQLAGPAGEPPSPWRLGQSDSYWTVRRDRLPARAAGAAAPAEAPYPGLVSLGTRADMRLLLNLEAVPGIVSVLGPRADREAVLASIAAELATSGWADRMTVTLVGFGEDLPVLAPTRVRYLADIGGLLEVMETESTLRRGNLRHTGHDSVLTGRTGPARGHQWAPHLVIIGTEPTTEQAERLGALAAASAPLGIGYLVTSDRPGLPGTAWEFAVTPEGVLTEPDMDLELTAQRLPARHRAAVVELFAGLGAPEDGPEGATGAADRPAFLLDLTARGKPEVYAELMGGFTVTGLPEPEPERAAPLREALALLLLHRTGVHPRVLGAALWPRGVCDDVRDAFLTRLREWLGNDASGTPRLAAAEDGRLALSPRVASDWDVLRTLHHHAVNTPGAPGTSPGRKRQLTDALALARGPLLDGQRGEDRFGWLEHEIVDAQYPLLVAEIALTLSAEHLAAEEGEPAYLAVRSALAAAPGDERLWNALLRAAHATGRPDWLAGAARWLVAHHEQLFGPRQPLPAQTEALLDELLPSWRELAPAAG